MYHPIECVTGKTSMPNMGINLMLGGWESGLLTLKKQCVGYVCKQFVFCKNANENNPPMHIQHCYRVF